jgi:hypothetical protein
LDRIHACDPPPAELIVFIDGGDAELANQIRSAHPEIKLLVGERSRIGPGGGRDKCIRAATQPYFASFDDDSSPVDSDYFGEVTKLFEAHSGVVVFGAEIWLRGESELPRSDRLQVRPSFTGCGYVMRVDGYRQIRGFLPRPVPYGIEEPDGAIQFFAKGWKICDTGRLRVLHDTDLSHHEDREKTAGTIANAALFAFLHYPIVIWPWGLLQIGSVIAYALKVGRSRGIVSGLVRIPVTCSKFRWARKPLPLSIVFRYLRFRRSQ